MIEGLKAKFTGAELREYATAHIETVKGWIDDNVARHKSMMEEYDRRMAEWEIKKAAAKTESERWVTSMMMPHAYFSSFDFTASWSYQAQIRDLEAWIGRLVDDEEYLLTEAEMKQIGAFAKRDK